MDDVLKIIFNYLDFRSLISIIKVCKGFREFYDEKIKNTNNLFKINNLTFDILDSFKNKDFVFDINLIKYDDVKINKFLFKIYIVQLYSAIIENKDINFYRYFIYNCDYFLKKYNNFINSNGRKFRFGLYQNIILYFKDIFLFSNMIDRSNINEKYKNHKLLLKMDIKILITNYIKLIVYVKKN